LGGGGGGIKENVRILQEKVQMNAVVVVGLSCRGDGAGNIGHLSQGLINLSCYV